MIRRTLTLLSVCAALAACGSEPTTAAGELPARRNTSPLTVTIEGPTDVPSNSECAWTAYVDGGTPPYRRYWNYNGVYGYVFGATFVGTLPKWGESTAHQLQVVVKDAAGQEAVGYHDVLVYDWAPLCPSWP